MLAHARVWRHDNSKNFITNRVRRQFLKLNLTRSRSLFATSKAEKSSEPTLIVYKWRQSHFSCSKAFAAKNLFGWSSWFCFWMNTVLWVRWEPRRLQKWLGSAIDESYLPLSRGLAASCLDRLVWCLNLYLVLCWKMIQCSMQNHPMHYFDNKCNL